MSSFGFLKGILGLNEYAGRAIVCPGIAGVSYSTKEAHGNLTENFNDLTRVSVGASHLLLVKGENLSKALSHPDSHHARQRLQFFLENDWPLSLFLSRGMYPLVNALGIGWDKVLTPDPVIADQFDDKWKVRLLAQELHAYDVFPPWAYVSSSLKNLNKKRNEVLSRATIPTSTVFLKVHNYDGGQGILRWTQKTDPKAVESFAEQYLPQGIVMDAGYPRDEFGMQEFSAKILVHEDRWEVLYFTSQRIVGDAHIGNDVAIGEEVIGREAQKQAIKKITPICDEAVSRGYGKHLSRTMGVDFMGIPHANGDHTVYALEVNARQTAADYAEAVCEQVAPRFGGKVAVVMENIDSLPRGVSYPDMRDKYLKIPHWDGTDRPGLLLTNAGCLEYGKVTVFLIAKTLGEAREMRGYLLPKQAQAHPPILRRATRAS
ncbi:hypothetical protein KKG46_04710 [Patescibacteria group bacterium]|nr:hypothetical protein [Patescibacteria group bacterium]